MSHLPPLGRDSAIEVTGSDYSTGPAVTDQMVALAEERLGVRLPAACVGLLRVRNGGEPVRHRYPTPFPTSWADDHIGVGAILRIDGARGIDSDTYGTPSSTCRPWACGRPRRPRPRARRIADTFGQLLAGLAGCPE